MPNKIAWTALYIFLGMALSMLGLKWCGPAHAGQCDHELVATNTRYSACCLESDASGKCTRKGQRACTDWRCKLCGHEPDATCTGCAP